MRKYIARRLAVEGLDPSSFAGRERAFELLRQMFPRALAI
jgi:hypothetical protein